MAIASADNARTPHSCVCVCVCGEVEKYQSTQLRAERRARVVRTLRFERTDIQLLFMLCYHRDADDRGASQPGIRSVTFSPTVHPGWRPDTRLRRTLESARKCLAYLAPTNE